MRCYRAFECRLFVVAMMIGMVWGTSLAQTARPGKPADSGTPAAKPEDQAASQIAKAWGEFYSAKYDAAEKTLTPLLRSNIESAKVEATYLLGRCKLAVGLASEDMADDAKALAEAKKLWGSVASSTLNVNLRRQKIAQALELSLKDSSQLQACQILEDLLKEGYAATSTPEAAIELAKVYATLGRMDDAQKALDFAAAFAKKLPSGGEIPQSSVKPFIDHAEYLKKHLDPASEAFAKADRLRIQKKYPEAIKAFEKIQERHGQTDFGPRSEFSIGLCNIGMGKPAEAVKVWEKFISASNAGPWRGQAYVQLMDLYLSDLWNVDEAAKYATLAQNALATALADEKAQSSWQKISFDIGIHIGVIAYARKDSASAGAAFEKAKADAEKGTPKELLDSLDRLIAYCKAGTEVIPAECTSGSSDQKIATALGLGVIFNLCRQYDAAEKIFNRIITSQAKAATNEQLAFARFGHGAALQGRGKAADAKADYQESLKLVPAGKGSWQDETLYCLASLLQNEAQAKFGENPAPEKPAWRIEDQADKSKPIAKPPTPEELKKAEAERETKSDQLNKAFADIVPYWQDILDKYPKSPRVEPAMYYVSLALVAQADGLTDQAAQAKLYNQAVDTLTKLVEKYPKSAFAGNAEVKTIDICLERLFDLQIAQKSASAAVEWAKANADAKETADDSKPTDFNPWVATPKRDKIAADVAKEISEEIYLRSGLIAFLEQDYQKAADFLKLANPQPVSSGFVSTKNLYSIGAAFLLDAAVQKRCFTKQQAFADLKNERQKTIVLLADLYLWGLRAEKARSLYERILHGDALLGSINSGLEAYAIFEIAATYNCERDGYDLSILWLNKLNDAKYKSTYWQPYAKFRTALYTVNKSGDLKRSFALYQAFIDEYPNHPITELASAYYCINACVVKDKERALKASKAFFAKYPNSEWKLRIEKRLQELLQESQ